MLHSSQFNPSQDSEFNKSQDCDRCQYYTGNIHLRCTVRPYGIESSNCPDFQRDPAQEQHIQQVLAQLQVNQPEQSQRPAKNLHSVRSVTVLQPLTPRTITEQLALLDLHPLLTGCCPHCAHSLLLANPPQTNWECDQCGWVDASLMLSVGLV